MDNIFIDGNTGEIFNDIHHIVTNEQHEKYVEHKKIQQELQEKKDRINANYKEYGAFIWFLYNYNDVINLGVPPDMLTKLIYVSTFMDYKNRIMIADNKCMNRQQMQALLNISDVTFWRFLTVTAEANIMTEEDNVFYLNADIFERGIIKTFNKSRIRLYAKGIRYVYHKAKVTEHRLLSYLFQAIPFVSADYNMLCYNPDEPDLDKVVPMQFSDYCEIIGYDKDNARRLKTRIKKLRVMGEPVFSFVDNADGIFCYINPAVYYAGNNWDQVKILGEFKNKTIDD